MTTPAVVLQKNQQTNRWLRRLATVVAVLFLTLNAVMALGVLMIVQDAAVNSERNGTLLSVVLAVTGCTIEDTPEECQARIMRGSRTEGEVRIAAVDCLARRALAGLPAPDPPTACLEQTPPEIYPGVAP